MSMKKKERPITSFFAWEKTSEDTKSSHTTTDYASASTSTEKESTLCFETSSTDSRKSSSRRTDDVPEKPHQPKSVKFPMRDTWKQKRAFNLKWFDQFQFLHYRKDRDSVIFHTCALADKHKLLNIDTKKERNFIEAGFSNWKKAIEKFRSHADSVTHKKATEVLTRPAHINELLSQTVAAKKRENSRCMMKILENVVFLGKQRLALFADDDDKTGNFYQLILLRAKDDPALLKWIEKNYDRDMTPQAQNESIKLLALRLLRKIAADICSIGCYSLLADEATDVSSIEQLVIFIRSVTKDLIKEEDFVGLMPLEKANAANIERDSRRHL